MPTSDYPIEVRRMESREENSWDEYVFRAPDSSHSHLSGWRRVVARSYGHASRYLWAHHNGGVVGVLPLIVMRSFFIQRTLVSMPFLDDGGICADSDSVKTQLFADALRLYEDEKAGSLDLRHRHRIRLDLPRAGDKLVMILDLAKSAEDLWKDFDPKLRNQVRKASKSGLTASWSAKDDLVDFYDVFAANMRDLGSPVHSRGFFEALLNEFPDSAKIMLVRKDTLAIGGAICLLFKDTMTVPWASSLREFFSLCPNNLLYWEMIRWGCENGYQRFDFGRSSPNSGTITSKNNGVRGKIRFIGNALSGRREVFPFLRGTTACSSGLLNPGAGGRCL